MLRNDRQLRSIVPDEQYFAKCRAGNTVKINCHNSKVYRKLIKHMRDFNVLHHTYQLKEERAYRIMLKYVHHTVHTDDTAAEIEAKGYRIRHIINPYPTAFPYGNGMVLHFYKQQESSTTKTVHKVINKGLKTYV